MSEGISLGINYRELLNEDQHTVVTGAEGPCLVLAGAGSGKTRVLIYRVCRLLEQGVPPSSILLLTFTNKAAREMTERVEKVLGGYPRGLLAGTFHHAANVLLRMYGGMIDCPTDFSILDQEDSNALLKQIAATVVDLEQLPKISKVHGILSLSANTCESIRTIITVHNPRLEDLVHHFEAIQTRYQKKKRELNVLDYDDLLLFWGKLLRNPETGNRLAEKFRYVMVDEYHDTNKIQSLILYQLAKTHRNILAVGDDAQSIYSFRGATINNILEFSKVYADARIFRLNINYRSTPEILRLANNIIAHNRVQYPKKLTSMRKTGIMPVLTRCNDTKDEGRFVAKRIAALIADGIPPSDIAVLFRSRYQAAETEIEINRLRIPYVVRGGVRFFEQAHIKDVLAHFRVAENFRDEIAWQRILRLCDGIGKKSLEQISAVIPQSADGEDLRKKLADVSIPGKGKESIRRLLDILRDIGASADFSKGVGRILETGYAMHLEKFYDDAAEREEDVRSLPEVASGYPSLHDFLAEAALQEHFRGEHAMTERPVVLSTVHQAKGLEWRIIFIIGVSANHFPHPASAADLLALEEERRIFYVAVTRAKEDLTISYSLRDGNRNFPYHRSIFIEEMDSSLMERWDF